VARGVRHLVEQSGVVALGLGELPREGHLDVVQSGRVVGPVTAVLDLRATRPAADDRLARGDRIVIGGKLGNLRALHVVALLDVEDREVAEDQVAPLDILAALVLLGLPDRLPEDNLRALLALADRTAALLGLLERDPVGRRIACRVSGEGEEPDVDAAIRLPRLEGCRADTGQGLPGLVPRHGAGLKRLDDPIGDDVVGVCLR